MITFEEGNILDDKYTMICHQVNTLGIMGAGLAKQIKLNFPDVFTRYSVYCDKNSKSELLGQAYPLIGAHGLWGDIRHKLIWNLFAQTEIGTDSRKTNYFALEYALRTIVMEKLRFKWQEFNTLAIPYGIGCGLAGGDWDGVVYPMIQEVFKNYPDKVVIVKFN